MINSMTGFARREFNHGQQSWAIEIKGVNHRFLELSIRLPDDRRHLEAGIRSLLGQTIKRGKVDLWISARANDSDGAASTLNSSVLNPLLQLIKTLQLEAGSHGIDLAQPSLSDLLRWPNLVQSQSLGETISDVDLLSELNQLIVSFNQHRSSEGQRLGSYLTERLDLLVALVDGVRQRLPEVHERLNAKMFERLQNLNSKVAVQPERFEQEVVLLLQKMDVEEELSRLEGHRVEILKTLSANEPAGRRLDFLMQELNREANTLSSKSADGITTKLAVDMKVLIEQMREQVQNIE